MSEEGYYKNDSEAEGLVKKFEDMLAQDRNYYFDLDEFESIIEFYISDNKLTEASKAIVYASEMFPNSTVLMLREAQLLASNGHLERALIRMKNLLAFEPNNEEIHLSLASVYSQVQNHHKSITHLKEALRLSDKDLRDDIYIDIALEYENLNNFSKAVDILKEALMHNPENETAIHELAFCFEMDGQFEECIAYYKKFIDRHPYSYISWYNLGNAYMKLDDAENAVNAFDYSIVIEEDFGPAYFNRSMAYIELEKFDEAIDDLLETMRIESPQASTYCYIGECLEKLGKYDEAIVNYRKSIELNDAYGESYVGLGVVHDLMEKRVEALGFFKHAIELEPDNVDYFFLLADCLRKNGDSDEAIEVYQNLITLEPSNEEGWLEYTDLLAENEELEQAREQIELAILSCPFSIPLQFRKVAYLHSLGRKNDAYTLLQELLPVHGNQSDELTDYYPEIRKDPNYRDLCELYGK